MSPLLVAADWTVSLSMSAAVKCSMCPFRPGAPFRPGVGGCPR